MIRPLNISEAAWAAELHAKLMAYSVLAMFGPAPLRVFYEELARSKHGLVLVAERDGRACGVIAVMADRALFARNFVLKRGLELALRMLRGVLTRRECRRLIWHLPHYWRQASAGGADAEMLFIAVEQTARDKGLARKLIEAVLADLHGRGVVRVSVAIDSEHPCIGGLLNRMGFASVASLRFAEKQHDVLALDMTSACKPRTDRGAAS